MVEFIAKHPNSTLDDVINFLFKGTYNPELMTDVQNKPIACWGPFHALQDYGTPKKGPSRLFVATNPTGNKYREDGRATIPLRNLILSVNAWLERAHPFHNIQLVVSNDHYVNGFVSIIINPKEMVELNDVQVTEEAARIGATVTKLMPFVNFLNTHAGKIAKQVSALKTTERKPGQDK